MKRAYIEMMKRFKEIKWYLQLISLKDLLMLVCILIILVRCETYRRNPKGLKQLFYACPGSFTTNFAEEFRVVAFLREVAHEL